MWPYTHDEVKWLALPLEREAAERIQRAIDERWMTDVGVYHQPANDSVVREMSIVIRRPGR